jgi:NAD-dependent deacetylase
VTAGPVETLIDEVVAADGRVVVLTGAGISAASGIPTFRGPEGYWTVGSTVYTPMQMATRAMFSREPEWVWAWYLYRLGVCRAAEPNPAHHACVDLQSALGDRFLLITQNVDGLHLRAGSPLDRTFQVHGAIELMRCAAGCNRDLLPVPAGIEVTEPDTELSDRARELLTCPACEGWLRPHVLWFDEAYDEERYRFDSSLRAADEVDLLLTVGTSGATNLPNLVVERAVRGGAALIDINVDDNPFGELATAVPRGNQVRRPAIDALPELAQRILAA